MKITVKALTSFMHGRIHAHAGDEVEVTKGEADELAKAGMAQIVEEKAVPAEEPEGAKMDTTVQNKMEAEPENKAAKKPTAKKAD